jgi:nucleoid-associated protein YgaU
VKGMGSVERVLVLGIVVVIVAILGIAVWGATDDDPGALDPATDGGAVVQAPVISPDALPANITPPDAAPGAEPMSEIERLKALRDRRREELAGTTTQQVPGVTTLTDGGSDAASGALPASDPVAAAPDAGGPVALNHVAPVEAGAVPATAPGVLPAPVILPAAQDAVYTVASGDSLWKIAHKHYAGGDVQKHIDAILAANPALTENLKVGQKITLPAGAKADPARLPAVKQAAELGGRTYQVKEGDTLSTIAKKELGSAKRWNELYELNRTRIADPARITVGMTLTLPPKN